MADAGRSLLCIGKQMRFLADMGVAKRVVNWLNEEVHNAVHLRDEKLHKLTDVDIFAKAFAEKKNNSDF